MGRRYIHVRKPAGRGGLSLECLSLTDIEDKGVGEWEGFWQGPGQKGSVPGWKSQGRDREETNERNGRG